MKVINLGIMADLHQQQLLKIKIGYRSFHDDNLVQILIQAIFVTVL